MDWILSGLVLIGNYMVGKKLKWGWIILAINSLGWVYYALIILAPPQYGLVPSAILNFFITGKAAYNWFRDVS
jgi:hypothetical protein